MNKNPQSVLQQVNYILEKAFFAPLQINDWLAFHFNQPFLLGLSQDELVDLFARIAVADERLHPEGDELSPLQRVMHSKAPIKVLAHALASLKDDRPFLFHRTLASIPAIVQGDLDPDDYESIEELLDEALDNGLELAAGAQTEIDGLRREAMQLLEGNGAEVDFHVKRLLESEDLREIKNDSQLRLWLTMGRGSEGIEQELLPLVLLEIWASWSSALTGAQKNAGFIVHSMPELDLSSQDLASFLPPRMDDSSIMSATCPYCQGGNVINLDKDKIEAGHRCPHLIFIGTNDPMHLLRVLILTPANIGEDTLQLLDSYYQSVPDLSLFANIVRDFYQMLVNQDRIKESPVISQEVAYSHLRAYFSQPMPSQKESENAVN